MAVFLLDTSVIIDTLNNKRGRNLLLQSFLTDGHFLACSPITVTEIYAGMRPKEAEVTLALLQSLKIYPIGWGVSRLAGEFKQQYAKKGRTLSLGDVLIAATAVHHNLTLLTDNVKDFPMKDLMLYSLPK